MTKENAHLYLPFVQALTEGKTIQHNCRSKERPPEWEDCTNADLTDEPSFYRIKPGPVMVPLGPEDVPPGSALRYKLATSPEPYWMIGSVSRDFIDIYSPRGYTGVGWARAFDEMEIKRPGQDWKPCHKPT